MEDKQLHLNRPLLSVRTRRPSSPAVNTRKDNQSKTGKSLPVQAQLPFYRSELRTGPITNPGTVPFTWEHIPGRPKEDPKLQTPTYDKPPVAPKFPPGRNRMPNQPDSHAMSHENNCVTKNEVKNIESKKDTREELERSDSEDTDEAYVDALDTLSRAESYFINCSMSGLSGMDDLDLKPKGGFSSDLKTREFMMDRFLPAAKAMVSETPEPKNQLVVREEKRVRKVENQVYKPSLRYGPSFTNRYSHDVGDVEEEEESDDDYAQSGSLPGVCGLLPRFCFKSSVYLLNPVPGTRVGTRVPPSLASKRHGSSSSGSYSTPENEVDKIRAADFEDKASLRSENTQTQKASTDWDVLPQSVPDDKEGLGTPEKGKHSGNNSFGSEVKGFKTFQEFLADPEEDSGDTILEKTVYVDTIHKVESPKLRSSSSNVQKSERSDEDDQDIVTKKINQTDIKDFSNDSKKIVIAEQAAKILSTSEQSTEKRGMEIQKDIGEYEDSNLALTVIENKKYSIKSVERKKLSEFLIPPPLPKSPSDSWLGRTLPSISTKSRSSYGASTNPQSQFSKASTGNFKWENIVKSTNVQRQHMRYSEDVLAPIQET